MDEITQGIVSTLPLAESLTPGLLAYIDPGTGSLVFQVLIASLLTAGWMLRQVPLAILGSLRRALGRHRATPTPRNGLTIQEPASSRRAQPAQQSSRSSKAA